MLVLDGVFANEEDGPRFVECPAPTNRDLLSLAQTVFKKMEKFLAKSGYLRSESDALEEASLTPVERWYVRGLAEPSMLSPSRIVDVKSTAIECGGFSVHAQVRVAQGDRRGRERLCLYAARPPFAEDQLRMSGDGRVRLTLRRPAKNGQGAIVLSPVQFLRRLAWLVPPPAQHQVRYAGVLASASKVRRAIVPRPAPALQLAFPIENMRPQVQKRRMSWAKLLARVYSIDGERCLSCGGRLRPIGAVTESSHVKQTLGRMRRQRCARDPLSSPSISDRRHKPTQDPKLPGLGASCPRGRMARPLGERYV
ncbi:MAG: transposase [Deltaproteobacteria bacterium]|nr:transposase [Deltaproteobacteria bacterium]